MAVQFILGRSGTGKTSYCIKSIVDALLVSAESAVAGLEPDRITRNEGRETRDDVHRPSSIVHRPSTIDHRITSHEGREMRDELILLVPEQATYQAERAILADKRIAGYNKLNVLSFDRLQFLLLGKNTARPALSRIGQQMIIHRILRDNASKLKIFGSSANWPGLGRQMAQTIIELHQYAKTPEDVDQLLSELQKDERNNLAVLKFTDVGLIFKEYLSFIEGKFLDPDIQLNRSCQAVASASLARGAKLWVDGFASFTASELAILTELLKVIAEVKIALCLDPSDIDLSNPDSESIDPVGLFNPTQRTYAALIELIKKCKLPLAEPIVLERAVRFSANRQPLGGELGTVEPLAHIEQNLFRSETPKLATTDNIRIVSAPNARAEVQFVARQILRLVKEKDYRYRDIAVIASDIDYYEHYIRAYFDDYGVPFFIDKRKPLNQHAVVQLICSALQAVTGGFSNSDIFAYLKTDLVLIERGDVDVLENYCLAFGITNSDWQSDGDWRFTGQDNEKFDEPRRCYRLDEKRINKIRQKAIMPLLELADRLRPGDGSAKTISPEKFTQIIFDFLDSLQVRKTLVAWIEEATEQKDYTTVDEHRQFYDKLLNIFDELCEVFADQQMTLADFFAILHSAFSQLTLAFIPPSLDQVLVGSIERSRHPDLKAVFLIGATQKQFPVPVSFDTILTEDDRSAAESTDFSLAATASQKLAERQYLAYIAFTRPSHFLCVAYPVVDDKANTVPRSQFIADLESLFENLSEESIAGGPPCLLSKTETGEQIYTETELSELLCSHLGKDVQRSEPRVKHGAKYLAPRSTWGLVQLLDDICSDEQLAGLGSNVISAISYDNRAQLDRDIVKNLLGQRISSSATRLSTFAACPYQHFARYVLELKEREEFKLEPLDVGVFYHRVLDGLLKRLNATGKDFTTVKDEQLLDILREQLSELVREDSFMSNFARHSAHNTFIIHSAGEYLGDCVLAIAEMVRAGNFQPALSEVTFGTDSDILGQYELILSDGRLLSLNGKIDRLDITEADVDKAAIVFDYKRRAKSFSWSQFFYGLDMQLPIYMLAVRNAANSKTRNTVGAFYMPVEVTPARATVGELSQKKDSFSHKAKGLFNGEFAQQLDKKVSKDSKFFNFYVTKDGQPYGYYEKRAALKPADFERVLKFTGQKIIKLAEEVLSGVIDVRPYRLSGRSPCSYCKYRCVCRFDWQINDYNFLESLNKLQALEKIGTVNG